MFGRNQHQHQHQFSGSGDNNNGDGQMLHDQLPLALAAKYVQDTESYDNSSASAKFFGDNRSADDGSGSHQRQTWLSNDSEIQNPQPAGSTNHHYHDNNQSAVSRVEEDLGSMYLYDEVEDASHNASRELVQDHRMHAHSGKHLGGSGNINTDEKRGYSEDMAGDGGGGWRQGQGIRYDSKIPVGALLFMFGFLFMPLWWIGTIFPRGSKRDVDNVWRKYNSLLAFASILLLGLIIALAAWHAAHN